MEKSLHDELTDIFDNNNIKIYDPHFEKINSVKLDKNIIRKNLVLSGGGSKGIAHLGGLYGLEQLGILKHIKTIVGTSIGALMALLIYIGYKPDELRKFFINLNFKKMQGAELVNLFKLYGLDDGKRIELVMKKLINAKNMDSNITFKQIYDITGKTLIITGTCLNDKKVHYFSHKTFPAMPVITAVRISMSFPLYFTPVEYESKTYVDGGCMDNYPMHLFDDKNDLKETIGLYLCDIRDNIDNIKNIEDYIYHMFDCIFEGQTYNSLIKYESQSIKIEIKNAASIDFNISEEIMNNMFETGFKAVMNKFN